MPSATPAAASPQSQGQSRIANVLEGSLLSIKNNFKTSAFSNHLLINTEIYFKIHYKNFIYALNQENSIGILIYKNINDNNNNNNNEIDQIVFEFYIISYHQVIESLNLNKINKDEQQQFEQTLTMDLDQLWLLGLRVLQLFEDIINTSYPSIFS